MNEAVTPSMVYELLGRSLYVCNSIELRIKCMLLNSGCGPIIYVSPEELASRLDADRQKKIKLCKQPLGVVWKEVLELIYKVPSKKDFDEAEAKAEKVGKSVYQAKHHIAAKGLLAKVQKMMATVIEHRNYIAHGFAGEYSLDSPSSCKKAFDLLNSKFVFLNKSFELFDHDCKVSVQSSLMMRDVLQNEDIAKCIAQMMEQKA